MRMTRAEAAAVRGQQVRQLSDRPSQRRFAPDSDASRHARGGQAQLERAQTDSGELLTLRGYASVTEQPYEMWDMFGPYTEVVSAGAFDATLDRSPEVQLNYQHGRLGTPIASTLRADGPGSLRLSVDETGLFADANPLPNLTTTREVVELLEAGVIREMSFAFMIVRGAWSPDYMEFRIHEVDLDRGDVSVVNYGANPATSVEITRAADEPPGLWTPSARTRSAQARIGAALALVRTGRA